MQIGMLLRVKERVLLNNYSRKSSINCISPNRNWPLFMRTKFSLPSYILSAATSFSCLPAWLCFSQIRGCISRGCSEKPTKAPGCQQVWDQKGITLSGSLCEALTGVGLALRHPLNLSAKLSK